MICWTTGVCGHCAVGPRRHPPPPSGGARVSGCDRPSPPRRGGLSGTAAPRHPVPRRPSTPSMRGLGDEPHCTRLSVALGATSQGDTRASDTPEPLGRRRRGKGRRPPPLPRHRRRPRRRGCPPPPHHPSPASAALSTSTAATGPATSTSKPAAPSVVGTTQTEDKRKVRRPNARFRTMFVCRFFVFRLSNVGVTNTAFVSWSSRSCSST